MNSQLAADLANFRPILEQTLNEACLFLQDINHRPVTVQPTEMEETRLPSQGLGAQQALTQFIGQYGAFLAGSAGPRYLGFITGGATPASIAGDWLVSAFDQNVSHLMGSSAYDIEVETIELLKQLFHLPDAFAGAFVSGATMSNFVSLAQARQWVANQKGIDVAQEGLYALPTVCVLSGSPHSSIYKALSMLGMGRNSLQVIPVLSEREAIDVKALETQLELRQGEPCIVVANAGTVNTVDFDDLQQIGQLKSKYNFWLHVDAAFGGFSSCSPTYSHLMGGIGYADSITIDAHKWLNVPYDSAMQFTRHRDLQVDVFKNSAAYLGPITSKPDFSNLTPENSRRFRALPAWFTLVAYGKEGYQEIVERNCYLARQLGEKVNQSSEFRLLAPTRMNVVCFTLQSDLELADDVNRFLAALQQEGDVFLTPTVYKGTPGIRAAFSNWRTTEGDIAIIWKAMYATAKQIKDERRVTH